MSEVDIYASRHEGRRRTWALATPVLVWLFIQAGGRAGAFVAGLVGLNASAASGRWQDNITAMFSWGLVAGALILWLRYWEGRTLRDIGLSRWAGARFVAGLLGGLFMVVLVVGAGILIGMYEITGPGAWYDHLTPTWIFATLLALAGGTVQAVAKEALFRGWVLQAFARVWGAGLAIAASVLAFAVIHGMHFAMGPEALLLIGNLALMSWFLGLCTVRDGNLWGVAGLHTAWNLTCNLGFGLNVNGEHLNITPMLLAVAPNYAAPWWLSGGDFGPNGSVLMTLVVGTAVLTRLPKGQTKRRVDDDEDDLFE